jgi:hypothetical protein
LFWRLQADEIKEPNKHIGTFPTKGTYVHHYFGKVYLNAYVFRGLSASSSSSTSQPSMIPEYFVETASVAVTAAIGMINIILADVEVQVGLAGVPHYFYGMIAFACVFLAKAATKHHVQLCIDQQAIRVLIERLSDQMSATQVGRGHMIHRMVGGLRKMAESIVLRASYQSTSVKAKRPNSRTGSVDSAPSKPVVPTPLDMTHFDHFSSMDGIDVGFGDATLGFGMPFFDFEGTTLDVASPVFTFHAQ